MSGVFSRYNEKCLWNTNNTIMLFFSYRGILWSSPNNDSCCNSRSDQSKIVWASTFFNCCVPDLTLQFHIYIVGINQTTNSCCSISCYIEYAANTFCFRGLTRGLLPIFRNIPLNHQAVLTPFITLWQGVKYNYIFFFCSISW